MGDLISQLGITENAAGLLGATGADSDPTQPTLGAELGGGPRMGATSAFTQLSESQGAPTFGVAFDQGLRDRLEAERIRKEKERQEQIAAARRAREAELQRLADERERKRQEEIQAEKDRIANEKAAKQEKIRLANERVRKDKEAAAAKAAKEERRRRSFAGRTGFTGGFTGRGGMF
jgi:hypothetical protein